MIRPHVVRVREAEIFIETVPRREELRRIAQVPLAEDGRGVSARFEDLSDGQFVVADADLRVRSKRAEQADAIRVATCEQRRARRGANRLTDIEVREPHPFERHAVEVRCLDVRRTETADVLIALVVGENDDEIRARLCRVGNDSYRQEQQQENACQCPMEIHGASVGPRSRTAKPV